MRRPAIALAGLLILCAHPAFADCTSPGGLAGNLFYNDASSMMQFCDGVNWEPMAAWPGTGGAACTAAQKGAILYNSASNVMEFCNAANWIALGQTPGTGGTGCSNPAGARGVMLYNADYRTVQYCDGTNWRANRAGAPVTLDLDFIGGNYILNGATYGTLAAFITAAGGTFTRASTATYFDNTGTMQTAASGTPRIDYDPYTLRPRGLLIEEARTNLIYPTNQNFSSWLQGNTAVVTDGAATSPDGTVDAALFSATVTNGFSEAAQRSITAGASYTASIYVKAGTASSVLVAGANSTSTDGAHAAFDLATGGAIAGNTGPSPAGTYVSSGSQQLANGWWRIWVVFQTAAATNATVVILNYPTAGTFYFWGAQLEPGNFPTSYIPTTGAAATRAADTFNLPLPGPGNWFDPAKGTFISNSETFEPNTSTYAGYRHVWVVTTDDPANPANRLSLRAASPGGNAPYAVLGDGVSNSSIFPLAAAGANIFTKIAFACSASVSPGAGLSKDGAATRTLAKACIPDISGGLYIGGWTSGSNHSLAGHIARFTYMPVRMPDASLPDYSR